MTTTTLEDPKTSSGGLSRPNTILIGLLLVQAALIAWTYWPSTASAPIGAALLGDINSDDVSRLVLADNSDASIELVETSDGWVLAGADGYPVDGTKVDEMLDKLLAITTNRLVTRTGASHKRLQVAEDDFVRKINIGTSAGEQTLYLGSSPASGATHVRLANQDEAYLTADLAAWELNTGTASWIDTLYFEVAADEVIKLDVQNANGTLTFERPNSDESWKLADLAEGEELMQTNVSTLLNRVTNVRLSEPLSKSADPAWGFDAPQATVEITTRNADGNEENFTLLVGTTESADEASVDVVSTSAATNYYFKASSSDYHVTISNFIGKDLVEKSRTDYLAEPEEGEEAATDSESEAAEPFPLLSTEGVTSTSDISDSLEVTATKAISE